MAVQPQIDIQRCIDAGYSLLACRSVLTSATCTLLFLSLRAFYSSGAKGTSNSPPLTPYKPSAEPVEAAVSRKAHGDDTPRIANQSTGTSSEGNGPGAVDVKSSPTNSRCVSDHAGVLCQATSARAPVSHQHCSAVMCHCVFCPAACKCNPAPSQYI